MNERYYISTGAKNCFYTLRYQYDELVYFRGEGGQSESQVVQRDYHVVNLSIDREEAVAKAKARVGQDLSANFDVDQIVRRDEVDWSVFQAGKHQGKSIHEVAEIDREYLLWACENLHMSRQYAKSVELAKSFLNHELEARKAERAAQAAAQAAREQQVASLIAPLGVALQGCPGGFCESVGAEMAKGILPRGRGLEIVKDVLAKLAGRRNSKAYAAEYERVSKVLEQAEAIA